MQNWDDRELTGLIKSTLDRYEEEYIPGAWENFLAERRKKKKILLLFITSGIAASLIVGWFGMNLFLKDNYNNSVNPGITLIYDNRTSHHLNDTIENINDHPFLKAEITTSISEKNISDINVISSQPGVSLSKNSNGAGNGIIPITSFPDTHENNSVPESAPDEQVSHPSTSSVPEIKITEHYLAPEANEEFNDPDTKRRIRFGLNFSPGVNSTGTASSFNYSAGINTDFELFRNLQFSTGLQIEHQSVVTGSPRPEVKTEAELVNLDLPMNLKWKFFSGRSKNLYISGGVSTLAYLGEKLTSTTYRQDLVEISTMAAGVESLPEAVSYDIIAVKSVEETTGSPYQTIDFAGRVNILFGMEQQITGRLSLHIEPYMKIPVSKLAARNLMYTISGVTCKVSF